MDRRDAALAAEALLVRGYVEVLMRGAALDDVPRMLDGLPALRSASADDVVRIAELTERLLRNRRVPRTTCLQRALTRYAMLGRRGVATTFVVGVREGSAPLVGHAWLEKDGQPFLEKELPDCTPTFRHPSPA